MHHSKTFLFLFNIILYYVNLFSMVNHVINGTNCSTFLFSGQIQAKYSKPWRFSSCFLPRWLKYLAKNWYTSSVSQSGITRHKVLLFYWFHKGTMAEDTRVTHCKWNWKLVWWKLCNTRKRRSENRLKYKQQMSVPPRSWFRYAHLKVKWFWVISFLKFASELLGLKGSISKTGNFGKSIFARLPFQLNSGHKRESCLEIWARADC